MWSIENKSNIEWRIDPCWTSTGKKGQRKDKNSHQIEKVQAQNGNKQGVIGTSLK